MKILGRTLLVLVTLVSVFEVEASSLYRDLFSFAMWWDGTAMSRQELLGVLRQGEPPHVPVSIPAMTLIPGYLPYQLGSQDSEPGAKPDEQPLHSIYLDDYYIGIYEVSWGEYREFVVDGGYHTRAYWSHEGWQWKTTWKWDWDKPDNIHTARVLYYEGREHEISSRFFQLQEYVDHGLWPIPDNYPACFITWYEAEAYCNWLTEVAREALDGRRIRLPTEAEWEKAAAGNPASHTGYQIYPWGNDPPWISLGGGGYLFTHAHVVWTENGYPNGPLEPMLAAPVGSYPQGMSAYGLYDCAGNVAEWVADMYSADFYRASRDAVAPAMPTNPYNTPDGVNTRRVARGGSYRLRDGSWPNYFVHDFELRARQRQRELRSGEPPDAPRVYHAHESEYPIGFRIAMDGITPYPEPTPTPTVAIVGPEGFQLIEGSYWFWMGGDAAQEPETQPDEKPRQRVSIDDYYIGIHEVTWGEFRVFVNDGGYLDPENWCPEGWYWRTRNAWEPSAPEGITMPRVLYYEHHQIPPPYPISDFVVAGLWPIPDDHPASYISYYEAEAYCNWLTKARAWDLQGRRYLLPTEAQWEKAAGSNPSAHEEYRIYPWGNEPAYDMVSPSCKEYRRACVSWTESGCPNGNPLLYVTQPVGMLAMGVSAYGLHDCAGNVAEWVRDGYDHDFYERMSNTGHPQAIPENPFNIINRRGRNPKRVLRGGHFAIREGSWPEYSVRDDQLRVRNREFTHPSDTQSPYGFRMVLETAPANTPTPVPTMQIDPAGTPVMVRIDADVYTAHHPFVMGDRSWTGPIDCARPEVTAYGPAHYVQFTRPYYIGLTEVTRGQFWEFVRDGGYDSNERGHWSEEGWNWRIGVGPDTSQAEKEWYLKNWAVRHVVLATFDPTPIPLREDLVDVFRCVWPLEEYEKLKIPTPHATPNYEDIHNPIVVRGDSAPLHDTYPMLGLSYFEAEAYCHWLTDRFQHVVGGRFRLPTEAEWEFAAVYDPDFDSAQDPGFRERLYPWGDQYYDDFYNGSYSSRFGNGNIYGVGYAYTPDGSRILLPTSQDIPAPVGQYPEARSPFGLYDMAGNVLEWCLDWYHPTFYRAGPAGMNPTLAPGEPIWVNPFNGLFWWKYLEHTIANAEDDYVKPLRGGGFGASELPGWQNLDGDRFQVLGAWRFNEGMIGRNRLTNGLRLVWDPPEYASDDFPYTPWHIEPEFHCWRRTTEDE